MNKNIIAVCILNMITHIGIVGLFVFLACYFNHWWIALFAIFFVVSFEYKHKDDSNDNKPNEVKDNEE